MLPSTLTADYESLKPIAKPDPDNRTESRMGSYIDRASGASQLEGESRPDHTYAKSSIWRPQNYLVKPCRYLFTSSTGRRGRPRPRSAPDPVVDVETVDEEPPVPLPRAPAPVAPEPPVTTDEEPTSWADKISKTGWSPVQTRMLQRTLHILEDLRLQRLACRGRHDERFHLDESLEWGRSRLSNVLSGVGWNAAISRWLHLLLMKHLSPVEKTDYLSLLGRLKRRDRAVVEAMTAPGRAPNPPPVPVAGPPMDQQVVEALLQEKFSRLPYEPLFFVVPNSLECSLTDRFTSIVTQLRQMAEVLVVTLPTRSRAASVQQGLDQMVAEARARLAEVRGGPGANRPVVLIGWNVGAAIASLLAQLEPARAIVCLGYPHRTIDGGDHRRSTLSVVESTCPVMFVVGAKSLQCGPDHAEELRAQMRVTTQMVVAGGCDDRLVMCRADRLAMRVTQAMVDRAVVIEIYNFVGETLTEPAMPPPRPPGPPVVPPCRKRPLPPKQRRPVVPKLVIINPGKYGTRGGLVPHHNYAARVPPTPGPRAPYHRLSN